MHRIDGTAAKYEVINLVLTGTLERGLLAMVDLVADFHDEIFSESRGRTRINVGGGPDLFGPALKSLSGNPE